MDWIKYLNIAEELYKTNKQEYIRSSISRAYYSIFNIIRESNTNFSIYDDKIHSKIINYLKYSHDSSEQKIGITLKNMRDLRNDADYNKNKTFTQIQANIQISSAKHILKLLK